MLEVAMPRWRFDILHPIDIVEDLAIGHGYENLGEAQPIISMDGVPRGDANLMRRVRECMQGLGLQQVQSLTLSNESDQFENVSGSLWRAKRTVMDNHLNNHQTFVVIQDRKINEAMDDIYFTERYLTSRRHMQ